jgi:hypothetical protein
MRAAEHPVGVLATSAALLLNRSRVIFLIVLMIQDKKIYQPWPSRTLGATAGYGMNSHPTPGSLFALGWSRSLLKGIIRFYKSAEKKNIY